MVWGVKGCRLVSYSSPWVLIGNVFCLLSSQGGKGQGETAGGLGLKSLKIKQDWSQRRRVPLVKFAFHPTGRVEELLFSKNASPRSLWAELKLQPVVAQGSLPYLELPAKELAPPGFVGEREGFSYLLYSVTRAPPAEEGSRLGSALPVTWHISHQQINGIGSHQIL